MCCVYNGPRPSSRRAKKPARNVRQSSASSTSAGESEADDILAKMERRIAHSHSHSQSHASPCGSSPGASTSSSQYPIASTSTLPISLPVIQPAIYPSAAFNLPPPSAYLLPPSLPYASKPWSDSTATLVDPLALPPYPPTINTNLPSLAPMAPPAAVSVPSETNDSYFPLVPSPSSPGSLRSAWSSSSSGSSVESVESLTTPPNQANLFGNEFSLPPDPYQTYTFPSVDGSAADQGSAGFYSLPPAPVGLVDGLDGLAGLGLGYTPGPKVQSEQVQSWVGDNSWMGLMDPMSGSMWGNAI